MLAALQVNQHRCGTVVEIISLLEEPPEDSYCSFMEPGGCLEERRKERPGVEKSRTGEKYFKAHLYLLP